MISSSMLPDHAEDLLAASRRSSGCFFTSRRSLADAKLGERQPVFAVDAPRPRRHHDQPLAEQQRLLDRMGDQDDRLAGLLPELQDEALHLLPRQRVECAERLVHQDHVGVVGQAARQRDALLHPARQLVDRLFLEVAQTHGLEQMVGDLASARTCGIPFMRGPKSTFSRTLIHSKSAPFWNTMPRSAAGPADLAGR